MSLQTLTADEILAVPLDSPERIFSRGDAVKKEARVLNMRWHPDHNPDPRAGAVLHHVVQLSEAGLRKLADGEWEKPGLLEFSSTAGKKFTLKYVRKMVLEVGRMYVGRTSVAFAISADNLDLLENAERQVSALSYANDAMRGEFARYFPDINCKVETANGAVLVLNKTPDVLLLQDVLDHFKGRMPPRHVAWVISRLLNIACYLEMQGKVAHNTIGPDTVFISPKHHSVCLLGGWWFAAGLGSPLKAASQRMVLSAPPDVMKKKVGDSRTDMEMIKALGRELLGDATGVRLAKDSAVPPALVEWLQMSTHQSAVATYREWQERVLIDAFGARKFVELDISHDTLYA